MCCASRTRWKSAFPPDQLVTGSRKAPPPSDPAANGGVFVSDVPQAAGWQSFLSSGGCHCHHSKRPTGAAAATAPCPRNRISLRPVLASPPWTRRFPGRNWLRASTPAIADHCRRWDCRSEPSAPNTRSSGAGWRLQLRLACTCPGKETHARRYAKLRRPLTPDRSPEPARKCSDRPDHAAFSKTPGHPPALASELGIGGNPHESQSRGRVRFHRILRKDLLA